VKSKSSSGDKEDEESDGHSVSSPVDERDEEDDDEEEADEEPTKKGPKTPNSKKILQYQEDSGNELSPNSLKLEKARLESKRKVVNAAKKAQKDQKVVGSPKAKMGGNTRKGKGGRGRNK
jgi:hypothetical protein